MAKIAKQKEIEEYVSSLGLSSLDKAKFLEYLEVARLLGYKDHWRWLRENGVIKNTQRRSEP
jgi:hypothetical protein